MILQIFKYKTFFFLSFLFLILFSSCKPKVKEVAKDKYPHLKEYNLSTVSVDNHYSILIPSFLHPAPEELQQAPLHYVNEINSVFIIVSENRKANIHIQLIRSRETFEEDDSLIDVFAKMMEKKTSERYYFENKSKIEKTLINGCDSRIVTVTGAMGEGRGKYTISFTCVSGKDNFYVISTHCSTDDYEVYKEIFDKCIYSFEILGKDLPDAITAPYIKEDSPRTKKLSN